MCLLKPWISYKLRQRLIVFKLIPTCFKPRLSCSGSTVIGTVFIASLLLSSCTRVNPELPTPQSVIVNMVPSIAITVPDEPSVVISANSLVQSLSQVLTTYTWAGHLKLFLPKPQYNIDAQFATIAWLQYPKYFTKEAEQLGFTTAARASFFIFPAACTSCKPSLKNLSSFGNGFGFTIMQFSSDKGAQEFQSLAKNRNRLVGVPGGLYYSTIESFENVTDYSFVIGSFVFSGGSTCVSYNQCPQMTLQIATSIYGALGTFLKK
jgi:hypothetical protein